MQVYLSAWKDRQSNFTTVEVLWRYCEERTSLFKCGDGLRMQFPPQWRSCESPWQINCTGQTKWARRWRSQTTIQLAWCNTAAVTAGQLGCGLGMGRYTNCIYMTTLHHKYHVCQMGLKFTSNSLLCSGMLNVLTCRLCKLKWALYFCIDGFQMSLSILFLERKCTIERQLYSRPFNYVIFRH